MGVVSWSDEQEIDASRLTTLLGGRHPGTAVEAVEVVSVARCGEGRASTADRVVLDLTYAANPDRLPSRMLVKTSLASPRAPAEMFETEVRFYDEIRPALALETPRCFAAGFDPATGRSGLVLEDLSERRARFLAAGDEITVGHVRSILAQLARLHAAFWASPRFADDLSWVATPHVGGMSPLLGPVGYDIVTDQLRRHPFKRELLDPLGAGFDDLWAALLASRSVLDAAPVTLLHGDAHVGNTYLVADGGGLVDWQLQVRGCWAHDVAYLVATALPPSRRRAEGRSLVAGYVDELRELGVVDAPTPDEAWEWCRRAVLWGLVIGWLICPPANYGMDLTVTNIERMVAAVADLEALAAIADGPPTRSGSPDVPPRRSGGIG